MSFSVDEAVLVKCLRQAYPNCDALAVKKFDCEPFAFTPGTNHTSDIFEVRVEFECDGRSLQESLIFKVPYVHESYEIMKSYSIYEKESHMFTVIVPKLMEIAPVPAMPKHFLQTESQVLVLENLTKSGYQLADQHLWNVNQSRVLLEELARFHATSVKLHQLHPSTLEPASLVTMYREDVVVPTVGTVYPYLMEILKAEKVKASVLQKVTAYKERIDQISIYEIANRVRDFRVLVHGNLKPNNILLKYDDSGQPISAKILDYQTYMWKSPVFDFFYFFIMTGDCDVFEKNGDQLIDLYLTTLNDSLSALECNCVYSRDDFDVDMKGSQLHQVFTMLFSGILILRKCIPGLILYGDPSHVPTQQEMENIRKNGLFDSQVMKWFRYFEKQGYFD